MRREAMPLRGLGRRTVRGVRGGRGNTAGREWRDIDMRQDRYVILNRKLSFADNYDSIICNAAFTLILFTEGYF